MIKKIFFKIPPNLMDTDNTPLTSKKLSKDLFKIALPSIAESVLFALVSFIDMLMVSELGDAAIASIGLTNQPKFIFFATFLALSSAVNTVVARRFGQNNREGCNKTFNSAMQISAILSVVIFSLAIIFARDVMNFAGAKSDTIDNATLYFEIIVIGLFFNAFTMIINAAQRGIGKTSVTMKNNIAANLVNLVFNYFLIHGNLGFPALGVAGAAIATTLGNLVAFAMAVSSVVGKKKYLQLAKKALFKFEKIIIKPVLKVFSGAFSEQIFLRIGFFAFAIVVANLGTIAFTAHQIGMNVITISFGFGDGLSVAIASLVGQNLGKERPDIAKILGKFAQQFGFLISCVLSLIVVVFAKDIFELFSKNPTVIGWGKDIMLIVAVMLFLQISQVILAGTLRGAGDNKYVALTSLISVAILRPSLGFLFAFALNLGVVGIWIALLCDQFLRFALMLLRFIFSRWDKIKI